MGFLRRLFGKYFEPLETNNIPIPAQFRADIQQAQVGEERYLERGDRSGLDKAAAAWERIFQHATFPNTPDGFKLMAYNDGGTVFLRRYGTQGQLADLDIALNLLQTAVQRTPPDSPDRAGYLTNLGNGLRARYVHTGQLADLETAIAAYQDAVQRTPPDSTDRAARLNNLGTGLRTRYARTGQLADLEEAIAAYQDAVQRTPPDSTDRAARLTNLGTGLSDRYACTGQLADLEAAIAAYEEAVQRTPPDSTDRAAILNNLGLGLHDRYVCSSQLADLEAAIAAYQDAVQRTPPDSPARAMRLSNLGNGLRARYVHTGQLADLETAIAAYEEAVRRTPPDSPDCAAFLNNLGTGLHARYVCSSQLADLEAAIASAQDAVQRTPLDSPGRAGYLSNLGLDLSYRYARSDTNEEQKERDETEGVAAYEQACQLGQERQISVALSASRNWGQWALTRRAWNEANRAYKFGLTALEQLYQTQLLQQEQQSWQRAGQGLYAQAAYALTRSHDLSSAVALLEQGQARGLNDRLARDEANLLQVQQHSPDLFKQYQEAAGRLHQLEVAERKEHSTTTIAPTTPDWSAHRQQVQQARTDLQAAIAAIRQLDGYGQFLQPPRFAEVSAAVQPGQPLAYLVTTAVGSLAVLLYRASINAEVTIEPLWADAFTEADLNAFLFKEENGVQGGYLPGQFSGGPELRTALAEGLPLLGEKLLALLAQRLHTLELDHITLIPGGRLNLLPLHAVYVSINDQSTPFGEAFTVSYAPSARTLAASRHRLETPTEQPATLLVVGNPLPLPDGTCPLQFARTEAEEIAHRFGGTKHLYCETAATHAAITAAIPGIRYLHFSCHGFFDWETPLNSGLLLSDGVHLTLRQVLDEIPLDGTRLVTLSACQTAVTDFENLPDEDIGLPAGFLEAGAAGVLGSLWPVNDLSTALFMDHFYQLHWGNGNEAMTPAEALQSTQHWLRHLTVDELSTLFAEYKVNAPDAPAGRMAYALAKEKYTDFTLVENTKTTPYADPYYWAAFAFYGM